ncbi:MAG: hypothetical protein HRT57_12130, partial [Crocinitomicaceae bacterium]|nr:hypothetical protein [Crocinitomicaceae bacterium]
MKVAQRKIIEVDRESTTSRNSDSEDYLMENQVPDEVSEESLDLDKVEKPTNSEAESNKAANLESKKPNDNIEPKISQEAVDEALNAEEDARKAKALSIGSVFLLLSGVVPFLLGLGFIASIVLVILAHIKYRRSRLSRFNTAIGQDDEERARKW